MNLDPNKIYITNGGKYVWGLQYREHKVSPWIVGRIADTTSCIAQKDPAGPIMDVDDYECWSEDGFYHYDKRISDMNIAGEYIPEIELEDHTIYITNNCMYVIVTQVLHTNSIKPRFAGKIYRTIDDFRTFRLHGTRDYTFDGKQILDFRTPNEILDYDIKAIYHQNRLNQQNHQTKAKDSITFRPITDLSTLAEILASGKTLYVKE